MYHVELSPYLFCKVFHLVRKLLALPIADAEGFSCLCQLALWVDGLQRPESVSYLLHLCALLQQQLLKSHTLIRTGLELTG
ncbi:hypothetical protein GPECTOR_1g928 [Gonium pectorale]|uniref:Uncharacterized protein n=1 Tax=Gonium pectorale TaxID=33097 RepID=A0A150H4G8_GONPE|nr:hypothetical protein GPECTOR_1g928 [Gonium pectorale]|eukprot:KXZ57027.1 hypothetical protein GPECTOR_1g928 [Gonium pectorale]